MPKSVFLNIMTLKKMPWKSDPGLGQNQVAKFLEDKSGKLHQD
jgi:hypothetical protein